ncbi:hypothetical protein [Paracoccus angustae]|uniref:hypothetical protein n=1 Tax=Paracoccus angustae TaxID=1671480 RepID=UPI00366D1B89
MRYLMAPRPARLPQTIGLATNLNPFNANQTFCSVIPFSSAALEAFSKATHQPFCKA